MVPKAGGRFVTAAALLGVIVVAAIIVPANAVVVVSAQDHPSITGDSFQQATPEQNNSSIQHENPNAVDAEGDLSNVENWLSDRMSRTLVDCTEGLSVGEYDVCNDLNEEYPNWLDKYVDVASETGSSGGDGPQGPNNTSESFEQAAENQRNYSSRLREFNETRAEYREARQNGETARARRLARELQRIATRVNNTASNLTRNYRRIANTTGANVTGATTTINAITRNVTATVAEIEREQFANTTIEASARSNRISFLNPLTVTGSVETANGTALAYTTVELQTPTTVLRTTTNLGGEFNFTYRPVRLPLDTQQVTIRHAPEGDSRYLGNETTVPITVEQVEPTINATAPSNGVGFNETLVVDGRVQVNDTGAASLPITISAAGQQLGRSRSNDQGEFAVQGRMPATVPAGEQSVQVSYSLEGRALAPTNTSVPLDVVSTPTALSVTASQTNQSRFRVSGRLRTENGTPLGARTVRLGLNGTSVSTVRTNTNGSYATNITVPESILTGRSGTVPLTLTAVYDGGGTNLEESQATTRITLSRPSAEQSLLDRLVAAFEALSLSVRLALGAIVVLAVGIVAIYVSRREDSETTSGGTATGDGTNGGRHRELGVGALLDTAREQVATGESDQAIITAYGAARNRLSTEFELASPRTHWEFLTACRSRLLDGDRATALRNLTERYEQAAFAPDSSSTESATEAIETADEIGDTQQEQHRSG